jgi:phosphoglycerol transferase MdoB-like AlkP superfamily enzyme
LDDHFREQSEAKRKNLGLSDNSFFQQVLPEFA